jgi:hypothetical protein
LHRSQGVEYKGAGFFAVQFFLTVQNACHAGFQRFLAVFLKTGTTKRQATYKNLVIE